MKIEDKRKQRDQKNIYIENREVKGCEKKSDLR
jgi:hypothetical protein